MEINLSVPITTPLWTAVVNERAVTNNGTKYLYREENWRAGGGGGSEGS